MAKRKLVIQKVNSEGNIEKVTIEKEAKTGSFFNIPKEYFNLGMYLVVPLLVGIFFGNYLDQKFKTKALFTIILIIFGTISVFYNLYKLTKEDGASH